MEVCEQSMVPMAEAARCRCASSIADAETEFTGDARDDVSAAETAPSGCRDFFASVASFVSAIARSCCRAATLSAR